MEIIYKLLFVPILFFVGFVINHHKILNKNIAKYLLLFIFYLALPALILRSISSVELNTQLFKLPLIATIVISAVGCISFLFVKNKNVDKSTKGVFIVSTIIINTGIVLPFIVVEFGFIGLSQLFIFDLANGIIAYTFAFLISARYSKNVTQKFPLIIIKAVPLWALIVSLILNYFNVNLPLVLNSFVFYISELTIPLLILALGLSFDLNLHKIKYVLIAITFRMLLGFVFAYLLCFIFSINGIARDVVLIASSAPVGYNTLVFSSIHDSDTKFASSVVSLSILLGFVILFFRILILNLMY